MMTSPAPTQLSIFGEPRTDRRIIGYLRADFLRPSRFSFLVQWPTICEPVASKRSESECESDSSRRMPSREVGLSSSERVVS